MNTIIQSSALNHAHASFCDILVSDIGTFYVVLRTGGRNLLIYEGNSLFTAAAIKRAAVRFALTAKPGTTAMLVSATQQYICDEYEGICARVETALKSL